VEFKDAFRSIAWSADGESLFIFPARFDQPTCRVFRLEGGVYKDKPAIPNVTAGDLSPDGRWFAVASTGGVIHLLDAATLQPLPETPELKTTFVSPDATPETRVFSLVFSADGTELAGTSGREPARIWNIKSGTSSLLGAKSAKDQVIRVAFGTAANARRDIAAGMSSRVKIMDVNRVDQVQTEPVCLPDTIIYPMFSSDGKRLLTLSGSFWMALDTLRVWDLSFSQRPAQVSRAHFSGKNPPPWLPDLADAVAGLRMAAGLEEDDPKPRLLSDLRKQHAGSSVPEEYKPVWDRFLASGGQ
jgi:hypothetical protein